jgi:general secretion pathway protein K
VKARQQGLALVLVLWLVALLALMAGSYAYQVRTETRVIGAARDLAEGRALARGAVARVAFGLLQAEGAGGADPGFPVNGTPWGWELDGDRMLVRVIGASGLIDLNRASAPLLEAVLARAGLDPSVAGVMPDRLADWRDADDLRALNGAEDDDYRAAGRPEGAKDAPFEHAVEIGQVLGIDRAMADRLAPVLTVHGGAGLNPEHAPREVLALFDPTYAEAPDAVEPETSRAVIPLHLQAGGGRPDAYHVSVAVGREASTPRIFRAVIRLQDDEERAYRILEWTE